MNLVKCYQTTSLWFEGAPDGGRPVGVLWHDTGAGNPNLARYVQPSDDAADRKEMIELIGKNAYANDWNHTEVKAGLNAWIGKLADGSIATIQAGDWDIHPWGSGYGKYGSCNGCHAIDGKQVWVEPFWIQFEICDDFYKDRDYFEKVYQEAIEFTAYICEKFGIDPFGEVQFNGVTVPTILCHADAQALGLGSNHGDVYDWFGAMGREKSMNQVRRDVAVQMGLELPEAVVYHNGDMVRLKAGAVYTTGAAVPSWVMNSTLYYRGRANGGAIVISTLEEGAITGFVEEKWVELVSCPHATEEVETPSIDAPIETPPSAEDSEVEVEPEVEPEDSGDNEADDDSGEIYGQPEDGDTPVEIEGDADEFLESDQQLIDKILKLIGDWLKKLISFLRKS